jgi:CBS-domain-containing membrane protein
MSVAEAWDRMLRHLLKGMPVVGPAGQVVGILTDEDLLERAGLEQNLSIAERLDEATLKAEFQALKRSPLKVADVMTVPVITVQEDEPLGSAATRMAERGIKRLPVVDREGRLVGVLSRVDVMRQVTTEEAKKRAAKAPSGAARRLGDIMLAEVPTIPRNASLADVIARFLEAQTRRLIVIDESGRPLGLISDADVVTRVEPGARGGVLHALRGKQGAPEESTTADKLMSPGVVTATPDTTLTDAAHQMLSPQRKWLVVVDVAGKAVGLVDRQVLFRALMHSA